MTGESELVCSAHREWGERFQADISPLPPLPPGAHSWDPERPLRVGYISPDLFTHSVSYFAEAPLSHHSPARGFTHIVYRCVCVVLESTREGNRVVCVCVRLQAHMCVCMRVRM